MAYNDKRVYMAIDVDSTATGSGKINLKMVGPADRWRPMCNKGDKFSSDH